MQIKIDIAGLPGAEVITNEDVQGVFVPFLNGTRLKYKSGEAFFLSFQTWPDKKKDSKASQSGVLILPEKSRDMVLSDPQLAKKSRRVIWIFNTSKGSGDTVSIKDFMDIIGK